MSCGVGTGMFSGNQLFILSSDECRVFQDELYAIYRACRLLIGRIFYGRYLYIVRGTSFLKIVLFHVSTSKIIQGRTKSGGVTVCNYPSMDLCT